MRFASLLLMSVCFTTASFAFDDAPVTVSNSAAEKTLTPTFVAQPATTASAASAAEQAPKVEISDAQIKEMHSAGYKMEKKKDKVLFCKSEAQIGTRFETKVCGTYAEIKQTTLNSQDYTSRMQVKSTAIKGSN